MGVFSDGFSVTVGDGASPEVFSALKLIEVPEVKANGKTMFSRRTTGDTDNTSRMGLGREDGDDIDLVCERDFTDTAQDRLRTVYGSGVEVNIRFIFTDGTVTQTNVAAFLCHAIPITPNDPNGDGENERQTFKVKRNADWSESEA